MHFQTNNFILTTNFQMNKISVWDWWFQKGVCLMDEFFQELMLSRK
jgi:hypothetical protein